MPMLMPPQPAAAGVFTSIAAAYSRFPPRSSLDYFAMPRCLDYPVLLVDCRSLLWVSVMLQPLLVSVMVMNVIEEGRAAAHDGGD